jgi:hypothetical protein
MATIYHKIPRVTFDPEKNYFKTELVEVSRQETDYEVELNTKIAEFDLIGSLVCIFGIFGGFLVASIFGCIAAYFNPYFYIGLAIGIVMMLCGFILPTGYFWDKTEGWSCDLRTYYTQNEEELWAEAVEKIKVYNEEQQKLAEAWRAEHPLEEKIRKCLEDPHSSVDLAMLIKAVEENRNEK